MITSVKSGICSHKSLQSSLLLDGIDMNPSEIDGIIYGLIVAGHHDTLQTSRGETEDPVSALLVYEWLPVLIGSAIDSRNVNHQLVEVLDEMRNNALTSLTGDSFDIELLFPNEDASLNSRCESITAWCQGFILGFLHERSHLFKGTSFDSLPGDCGEILADILAIAESDLATSEVETPDSGEGMPAPSHDEYDAEHDQNTHEATADEEDEHAVMQIQEYLRVSVQLLYEDLSAQMAPSRGDIDGEDDDESGPERVIH